MKQHHQARWVIAVLTALLLSAFFAAAGQARPDLAVTYKFIPSAQVSQTDEKVQLRIATADVYALPLTEVEWRNPLGAVVGCRPFGGGCGSRNEYSSNGSLIATTYDFYIAGQGRSPGAYLAVARYCYPDSITRTCLRGWTELFQANFYINSFPVTQRVWLPLAVAASTPFAATIR